jgi:F-type H+-transporting ATPase subunit delta
LFGRGNWDPYSVVDKVSTGETPLTARYAAALYSLADEQGVLGETVDQMDALGRLIDESPALANLIGNRLMDAKMATGPMEKVLEAQGFPALIRNFVSVVIANRRLGDLRALVAGFAAYAAAKRGEVVATVTSALPLTDLQRIQLRARLTEAGYSSVRLDERTDPSLLGGLTLKIGAKLYDTSLKSRLQRLQYSLKGAA